MLHRNAALLALTVALVAPVQAQQAPRAPKLDVASYRLDNGLKVVFHRDPTVPRVTVCVAYHVGSKNERAGRTGFAHFFEHMMFRGTKHVPNYDIPLQQAGAQSNAFTTRGYDRLFRDGARATSSNAPSIWRPSGSASCPRRSTRTSSTPSARSSRTSAGSAYENVPYGLADETLLANVFPEGHPYSWSVIGSMKDLSRARSTT